MNINYLKASSLTSGPFPGREASAGVGVGEGKSDCDVRDAE